MSPDNVIRCIARELSGDLTVYLSQNGRRSRKKNPPMKDSTARTRKTMKKEFAPLPREGSDCNKAEEPSDQGDDEEHDTQTQRVSVTWPVLLKDRGETREGCCHERRHRLSSRLTPPERCPLHFSCHTKIDPTSVPQDVVVAMLTLCRPPPAGAGSLDGRNRTLCGVIAGAAIIHHWHRRAGGRAGEVAKQRQGVGDSSPGKRRGA